MLPVNTDSDRISKAPSPTSNTITEEPVTPTVFQEEVDDVLESSSKSATEPMHRKCLSVGGIDSNISSIPSEETTKQETLVRSKTANIEPVKSDPSPTEEVDSGISQYVALLRARGHKRVSSAPVSLSPSSPQSNSETTKQTVTQQTEKDISTNEVPMRPRR